MTDTRVSLHLSSESLLAMLSHIALDNQPSADVQDRTNGTEEQELPKYSDVRREQTTDSGSPTANINTASRDMVLSPSQPTTEHVYSLKNAKGRAWLTLRVMSRAQQAKSLPVYFSEDTITGTVETNLYKAESSKGVTIAMRGETTAVGQEGVPFLDVIETLWTPASSSGNKLTGKLIWPFALKLPRETVLAETPNVEKKPYPLPPTFTERASPAYIDYKLVVTVRKGALRVNQVLFTTFALVPRSRAPAPSPLRRLAYSEGSALIGPEGDPEGWTVLPSVNVKGMLFDTKAVDVDCTLALATPLSYAIGSPIPLLLTLRCGDDVVLDLFSVPSAVVVYLTRSIAIGSEATNEDAPRRSNNTFPEHVGKAFFWPATEGAPEANVKKLHGEIDVRRGLKPSFVFPRFTLRYYINVLPFTAPGFASATPGTQPLLSKKISIVSENAPGVIPRSHAPPGYARPDEGDYNNSVGYLENGNQRFYHHHPGF